MVHYENYRQPDGPDIDVGQFRDQIHKASTSTKAWGLLEAAQDSEGDNFGWSIVAELIAPEAMDEPLLRRCLAHAPQKLLANVRLDDDTIERLRKYVFQAIAHGSVKAPIELLNTLTLRGAHQPTERALQQLKAQTMNVSKQLHQYIDTYEQALRHNWRANELNKKLQEDLRQRVHDASRHIAGVEGGASARLAGHPDQTPAGLAELYSILPTSAPIAPVAESVAGQATKPIEHFWQHPGICDMIADWMQAMGDNIDLWSSQHSGPRPRSWRKLMDYFLSNPHPEIIAPEQVFEWAKQEYGDKILARCFSDLAVAKRYARVGGQALSLLLSYDHNEVRKTAMRAASEVERDLSSSLPSQQSGRTQ